MAKVYALGNCAREREEGRFKINFVKGGRCSISEVVKGGTCHVPSLPMGIKKKNVADNLVLFDIHNHPVLGTQEHLEYDFFSYTDLCGIDRGKIAGLIYHPISSNCLFLLLAQVKSIPWRQATYESKFPEINYWLREFLDPVRKIHIEKEPLFLLWPGIALDILESLDLQGAVFAYSFPKNCTLEQFMNENVLLQKMKKDGLSAIVKKGRISYWGSPDDLMTRFSYLNKIYEQYLKTLEEEENKMMVKSDEVSSEEEDSEDYSYLGVERMKMDQRCARILEQDSEIIEDWSVPYTESLTYILFENKIDSLSHEFILLLARELVRRKTIKAKPVGSPFFKHTYDYQVEGHLDELDKLRFISTKDIASVFVISHDDVLNKIDTGEYNPDYTLQNEDGQVEYVFLKMPKR